MVFDKLDEAFNGKNVRLLLTDSGLQEDFNVYDLTQKTTTPRNRVSTRGGVGDFYAQQLKEITYETVVTKQMMLYLVQQNTLTSRSALPPTVSQVSADSLDPVANDLQEDFTAEILDLERNSIDGNYWWVRVHMILKNTTYTIA